MKKTISILTSVLLLGSLWGCAAANPAAAPSDSLSKEQAQEAALEHAGLTAQQVTGLQARYEVDDGVAAYEVEFYAGDYEYDYTIHAETGKVLEWDKDREPRPAPTDASKPTEPATPSEPEAKPQLLTAEEAEAIALEHAGLTAQQVTGLKTEYEVDDGIAEYSVDFYANGWEYEYEIHAETGKILSWDQDD